MIKKTIKSIWNFLNLWDGLWSVPLALFALISYSYAMEYAWPDANFGGMTPVYAQKVFYAAYNMVFINLISWLGIFFSFRAVWWYYYKESASDFFNKLSPKEKILCVIVIYFCFYFSGLLLVLMPV